jgi:hypothetical protein
VDHTSSVSMDSVIESSFAVGVREHLAFGHREVKIEGDYQTLSLHRQPILIGYSSLAGQLGTS